MKHILIVEDERPINDLMEMSLRIAGYRVTQVFNGSEALDALNTHSFDLMLLDLMLPGIDGLDLLKHIRGRRLPVIIVSARINLADRVNGLAQGADDYLVKPFEPLELVARVEALLRRASPGASEIHLRGLTIHPDEQRVRRDGCEIALTNLEFQLLMAFVRRPGVVFSREQLLAQVWGIDYMGETRTVDVHIQRLRKKLNWERVITTAHRSGYRLEEEE
ncbi:MAG: response regulator transcription factor [Christensenellaceae bacterium]|nr:response regulator transcription factor [Christensenellaceae bacterium]MEA5067264.1 response regulator transcription factor [Eubacteriales bacterium]MEA5067704.1 response regulator transcription factor [Christensenellaceae bacterium]